MTQARALTLLTLVLTPILVLVGFGGYALWESGWLTWLWWMLPLFWGAAHLLARRWRASWKMLADSEQLPPLHWTARDQAAQAIVKTWQEKANELPPEKLTQPEFYLETAMAISQDVARHYHPRATDPIGSLTVLEFLAAGQLAFEDLEIWFRQYVPGSHLVTVDQWKLLGHAPKWVTRLSNLSWLVSIVMNPAVNIPRYVASQVAVAPMTNDIQNSLLGAFYVAYVSRIGRYVIEMNSGRLRVGAARYREALNTLQPAALAAPAPAAPAETEQELEKKLHKEKNISHVTISVIGQVKAGKSSLINALLRQQQAAVDVLPTTRDVDRYRLTLENPQSELVVLDTPGYADSGATAAQMRSAEIAAQKADVILLVMNAASPARNQDRIFLEELLAWFAKQPHRKVPPILAVLTHIDRLSPMMEWEPPYQWHDPQRPKERSLRDAVDYNSGVFKGLTAGTVAVCTDAPRNRVYGVEEFVVPAVATLLGEGRACAMLRTLHHEHSDRRVQDIFRQLLTSGRTLVQTWLEQLPELARDVER